MEMKMAPRVFFWDIGDPIYLRPELPDLDRTDYWAACCEPGAEYPNPSLQNLLLNFQMIGQSVTIPSTLLSWVDITRKISETLCVSKDPSDG